MDNPVGPFVTIIVLGAIAYVIWKALQSASDQPKTHVCPNCRSVIHPARVTPGSTFLEVLLWLCFLLPGILYTAWCSANKKTVCPICGAQNLVPLSTPAGQALVKTT